MSITSQTVYLVEDDENIRELISYALKTIGFDFLGFENGTDFFIAMQKDLPALILLDIMLPSESGIDILKKLKEKSDTQKIPVMMLTAKSSEMDKVIALDCGADDYITKPFGVLELLSRIKALMRRCGESVEVKNEILTVAENIEENLPSITLDLPKRIVLVGNTTVDLTYKEFELLTYLMQNQKIVLTREKIMQVVWGFDFEGESRTVDMHIKLLRQKLLTACDHIKTVRGVGYKIV